MKLINLLPKSRQEEIAYEKILKNLYSAIWISLASFALVFLAQVAAKLYLQERQDAVQKNIENIKNQVDKKENAEVKQKIVMINNQIADYKNLADSVPKWSRVLKAFSVLPPQGVKINNFQVNVSARMVTINGFSPTREKVIELYNNLVEDSQNFYNVDYPLENLIRPTDVAFHYTFYIREDLLK